RGRQEEQEALRSQRVRAGRPGRVRLQGAQRDVSGRPQEGSGCRRVRCGEEQQPREDGRPGSGHQGHPAPGEGQRRLRLLQAQQEAGGEGQAGQEEAAGGGQAQETRCRRPRQESGQVSEEGSGQEPEKGQEAGSGRQESGQEPQESGQEPQESGPEAQEGRALLPPAESRSLTVTDPVQSLSVRSAATRNPPSC
ncbi:hypothetical protein PRIEUP_LOCUS10304, partial [Pristimantis euphronides]